MRPGYADTLFLFGRDEVNVADEAHFWQRDHELGRSVMRAFDASSNAAILEGELGDLTILALLEAGRRYVDHQPKLMKYRPNAQYQYWISNQARAMMAEYATYLVN